MARNTDMMHFRADPKLQARLAAAVHDYPERFESQSHLMRLALRYYLNRLDAGALNHEPEPDPKTPAPTDRRLRAVPPVQRSTDVAT